MFWEFRLCDIIYDTDKTKSRNAISRRLARLSVCLRHVIVAVLTGGENFYNGFKSNIAKEEVSLQFSEFSHLLS
ncbi:unnamed protein product, partial [Vitis vinifera]|uniref:Uncharacterized protein n=1 Tax=Vitis vinifera TaxID=29760 RepID=D7SYP9_VITVI